MATSPTNKVAMDTEAFLDEIFKKNPHLTQCVGTEHATGCKDAQSVIGSPMEIEHVKGHVDSSMTTMAALYMHYMRAANACALMTLNFNASQCEISDLKQKLLDVQKELDNSNRESHANTTEIEKAYEELLAKYDNLKSEDEKTNEKYASLYEDYYTLRDDWDDLKRKYEKLKESCIQKLISSDDEFKTSNPRKRRCLDDSRQTSSEENDKARKEIADKMYSEMTSQRPWPGPNSHVWAIEKQIQSKKYLNHLYKTIPCKKGYTGKGYVHEKASVCEFGHRCVFAHNEVELDFWTVVNNKCSATSK